MLVFLRIKALQRQREEKIEKIKMAEIITIGQINLASGTSLGFKGIK